MSGKPHPVLGPPVDVRELFASERARLLDALEGLEEAAWASPTPCPGWSVHDIAAHVLGDDVGRLARTRDGFTGVTPSEGERFPQFIDRINEEWVVALRRMGPHMLLSSLAWTGSQITAMWDALSLDATGEPVSWAGPDAAPVWLDAARDFTEYWVHRQQINEALGQVGPQDAATLHTVIDTFMRALPYTLRSQQRSAGTTFSFIVPGPAGGTWTVVRHPDGWRCTESALSSNTVVLDAENTWKLCIRMVQPDDATDRAEISGDCELGIAALRMVSIIRAD